MEEPKVRFFNKNKGHYPKEHGVAWIPDDDNKILSGYFSIQHLRTVEEKRIDSLKYFQNYLKEYVTAEDNVKKKYYSDKFNRICEYYGFPFKSIDEAIGKGVDECIRIVKLQWD